jgi:hypothetical protein
VQNPCADVQKIKAKTMTDHPPDVWALLEQARDFLFDAYPMETRRSKEWVDIGQSIDIALAQSDRFVLVPKEPTPKMIGAAIEASQTNETDTWHNYYRAMLTAAPKPERKP